VHAFDDHVVLVDELDDRAAAALVTARNHEHFVALANSVHHNTSGASEMIFMTCAVRSSRVTGPKMRVPIGSSLFVSSTAALSSNRISEPCGRRTPIAVRATPAL